MSDACTITGLAEFNAAVTRLPDTVTLALKRVAEGVANRVMGGARTRLLHPSPGYKHPGGPGQGALAAEIEIVADVDHKQYIVESHAPGRYPANLPLWVEFGTEHMPARPYMAPSLKAESAQYVRDVEAAAVGVVRQAIEG